MIIIIIIIIVVVNVTWQFNSMQLIQSFIHVFSGWHSIFGKFKAWVEIFAGLLRHSKCPTGTSNFHKAQKQSTSLNERRNLIEHGDLHDSRTGVTVVTHQPLVPPDTAVVVTEGETAVLKWVDVTGQNPKIEVQEHRDTTALVYCLRWYRDWMQESHKTLQTACLQVKIQIQTWKKCSFH